MKQIFLVGLKVNISYDLLEKKLFKGWQVYKSYTNEYAISKVRPYYVESFEEAKSRYIEEGWHAEFGGLTDIYKSSDHFDWDIFCSHKFYEKCIAIKNYVEKYDLVDGKEALKIVTFDYLKEYLSAEDFKEWFWDTESIQKLARKENRTKETIIKTIESSNDKDFELPF